MKNTILTIITIISLYSCKAQTVYNIDTLPESRNVIDNYYMKDINNYNDAFVGTWKWETSNSSYEIVLQEFEMYSDSVSPNIYRDKIFGKYKYIENEVVISETTAIEASTDFNIVLVYKSQSEYIIYIKDIVSNISKRGTMTITSPTTATLDLQAIPGIKIGLQTIGDYTLPTQVTLTKQ